MRDPVTDYINIIVEMRLALKNREFSSMKGLIERVQILGNKVEASLNDKRDLLKMNIEHSELRKKIKALRKEIKDLEKKLPKKEEKKK